MSGFDDIEMLLRDWIGLDAATVGQAAVHRAVRQRMQATGIEDPAAFARVLRSDAGARDLLVEEVIVAESWFFRDRQVFDFVADFAVTRAALPGLRPVRILCAPAAGGEEPFSVAMALLEAGLSADQFLIDAIDISRRALERAAAGRYSANAFRNADLSFRDRWFSTEQGQAVLAEAVRRQVRLEWANLLEPGFAAGRPTYDVIFCRNLLIYLTDAARRQVEAQLDRLLAADGLLILGAAEPPIMKGDWIPAGTASVFALRRGGHAAAARTAPNPAAGGGSETGRPLPTFGSQAGRYRPRGCPRRSGPAGQPGPAHRCARLLRAPAVVPPAGPRALLPDGDASSGGRRSRPGRGLLPQDALSRRRPRGGSSGVGARGPAAG